MSDLISRQAAIDEIKALYEWHDTVTEDRTIDHLKRLPSAQPEQRLSCKNCIHLGHGYMMPCQNCKRNQMLPDWYEV